MKTFGAFGNMVLGLAAAILMLSPVYAEESKKEILVSAAISLKKPLEEIKKAFELNNKDLKVLFNFGASGSLARQIEAGAPVDVFASASPKDMDDLAVKDLIEPDTRVNFAGNSVVLIKPVKSAVRVETFKDLATIHVKRIAIGNPATVPAGRYAVDIFNYYKISDSLKDKLVLAENVRQVIGYVARGEVDAGVAYSTDVSGMEKEIALVVTAPEDSHKPVIYPIAVIKGGKNGAAREFVKAVTSDQGKEVLKRYGFKTFR